MAVRNGQPDEVLGDLYPFEDHYMELPGGHTMHYIEAGKPGFRGPTFLLLHGNPTWSFLYRDFMGPLAKLGRVIAVDHIGFGRSDHPTELGYYTLERHIANIEAFVAKKRLKRVVLVVQDWGGPIGLGFATRHPDKVAGVVTMNTWSFVEAAPPKIPRILKVMRSKRVGAYLAGRRNVFVERLIPMGTGRSLSREVMDGYRHPFPSPDSRQGIVAFPRLIPDAPGHPSWATMAALEQKLPDLDVPALVLHGTGDPVFGKGSAWVMSELLPQAGDPIWLEDGNHFVQEKYADQICALIEHWWRYERNL